MKGSIQDNSEWKHLRLNKASHWLLLPLEYDQLTSCFIEENLLTCLVGIAAAGRCTAGDNVNEITAFTEAAYVGRSARGLL